MSRTPETAKKSASKLVAKATPKPPKVTVADTKVQAVKETSKTNAKKVSAPPGFDKVKKPKTRELTS